MRPQAFSARRCDKFQPSVDPTAEPHHCDNTTVAYMGMHVDQTLRGKYYLRTRATAPFANNQLATVVRSA